jgi:hypothetical protein
MNARWLLLTTNIRATYWQGRLEELTFAVDPATQRQSRLSSPGLTASVIRSAQQDGTIQAAELVCHQLAQAMVKMQREREIQRLAINLRSRCLLLGSFLSAENVRHRHSIGQEPTTPKPNSYHAREGCIHSLLPGLSYSITNKRKTANFGAVMATKTPPALWNETLFFWRAV